MPIPRSIKLGKKIHPLQTLKYCKPLSIRTTKCCIHNYQPRFLSWTQNPHFSIAHIYISKKKFDSLPGWTYTPVCEICYFHGLAKFLSFFVNSSLILPVAWIWQKHVHLLIIPWTGHWKFTHSTIKTFCSIYYCLHFIIKLIPWTGHWKFTHSTIKTFCSIYYCLHFIIKL